MSNLSDIIDSIFSQNLLKLTEQVSENIGERLDRMYVEMRQQYAVANYGMDYDEEYKLVEDLDEAAAKPTGRRFKIVRVRIRKDAIQRNKKVATQPGYTLRGGKIIKMTPMERRRRRRGQRIGKIKRRAKESRSKIKYRRSIRKRNALGV